MNHVNVFTTHEFAELVQQLNDWGPGIEHQLNDSGSELTAIRAGI